MCDLTEITVYLQVISILIAVLAIIVPVIVALVGFVFFRQTDGRIGNISDQVDQLWDAVESVSADSPTRMDS